MEMEIEYVAFDGVCFDNKEQCTSYERRKEKQFMEQKRLAFWSTTGGTLTAENIGFTDFLYLNNDGGNFYARASIMFIKDQEVLNYIRSVYIAVEELGFYFWNGVNEWISAKEIKKQCCKTIERINELMREWDVSRLEDSTQVEPINLSKIWSGVDPILKDELMFDEDGIVYPF